MLRKASTPSTHFLGHKVTLETIPVIMSINAGHLAGPAEVSLIKRGVWPTNVFDEAFSCTSRLQTGESKESSLSK